jgi:hypothetical protein
MKKIYFLAILSFSFAHFEVQAQPDTKRAKEIIYKISPILSEKEYGTLMKCIDLDNSIEEDIILKFINIDKELIDSDIPLSNSFSSLKIRNKIIVSVLNKIKKRIPQSFVIMQDINDLLFEYNH